MNSRSRHLGGRQRSAGVLDAHARTQPPPRRPTHRQRPRRVGFDGRAAGRRRAPASDARPGWHRDRRRATRRAGVDPPRSLRLAAGAPARRCTRRRAARPHPDATRRRITPGRGATHRTAAPARPLQRTAQRLRHSASRRDTGTHASSTLRNLRSDADQPLQAPSSSRSSAAAVAARARCGERSATAPRRRCCTRPWPARNDTPENSTPTRSSAAHHPWR